MRVPVDGLIVMYGEEDLMVKSTVPEPRAKSSSVRFSGVYGSRAARVRVESGAVDVLPWIATPRRPLDGALVEMVWTEGMVFPDGSCLGGVS